MKPPQTEAQRIALVDHLRRAYMEVFPTNTVEKRLDVLPNGSDVAVTCSPSKGVQETMAMTERLVHRGFEVIPHIAARTVSGSDHLHSIMGRLDDLGIDSVFIPGGDGSKPAGPFSTAFDLLRAISQFDHKFTDIGVAAHPEGHPDVDDERLLDALLEKQGLATYMVTQMCFDAELLENWLRRVRQRGIKLPVWIGLPGVVERNALMKTSMRIGVGDSLRYLRKSPKIAGRLLFSKTYRPDQLLQNLTPLLVDPTLKIDGFHIYCFNQVEAAEAWRHKIIEKLDAFGAASVAS